MSRESGGIQAHTVLAESGGKEPSVQGPEFSIRTETEVRRPSWRSTSFGSPFRDPGVPDKDLAQLFSGLRV